MYNVKLITIRFLQNFANEEVHASDNNVCHNFQNKKVLMETHNFLYTMGIILPLCHGYPHAYDLEHTLILA